jgi:hypothetical protein
LTEASIPSGAPNLGKIHLGLTFQKEKGGYLPTVITFKTEKSDLSGEVRVDYRMAGDLRMPVRVTWHCDYPEKVEDKGTLGDSLAFYHYEINDVAVNSPLPSQPAKDVLYWMQKAFNKLVHDGMEVHCGFGPFLANSPQIDNRYSGYNGSFGFGYEFDRRFSLSFEIQGADYNNKVTGYDLYNTDLMVLAKYRPWTGWARAYLLGGLGVALTNYFPDKSLPGGNPENVGPIFEAGLGTEVEVFGDLFLFAQSYYADIPLSSSFAQKAGVDNQFFYVPLQFGLTFEH